MRHQFNLALHRENQEQFTEIYVVYLAFLAVITKNKYYLGRLPLQFQHDLDEIDKSYSPVFVGARNPTGKYDLLYLSRAAIEFALVLNTLLYQILLSVLEHLAHHVPCNLNVSILYEVKCYVHVIFFECSFKAGFVQFDSVKTGFCGESLVAFGIFEQHLDI